MSGYSWASTMSSEAPPPPADDFGSGVILEEETEKERSRAQKLACWRASKGHHRDQTLGCSTSSWDSPHSPPLILPSPTPPSHPAFASANLLPFLELTEEGEEVEICVHLFVVALLRCLVPNVHPPAEITT